MCKLCKRLICPTICPDYERKEDSERALSCVLCGTPIARGEVFYEMHGFPYCPSCLRAADGETLVRICEKKEQECFVSLGFLARTVGGER